MSAKALGLTALLVAVVAVSAVAAAATPAALAARVGRQLAGGWGPIKDVSDPHIQELGGWAVAEHARRANDGLRFGEVTGGEQQLVSGMNYKLVLKRRTGRSCTSSGGPTPASSSPLRRRGDQERERRRRPFSWSPL